MAWQNFQHSIRSTFPLMRYSLQTHNHFNFCLYYSIARCGMLINSAVFFFCHATENLIRICLLTYRIRIAIVINILRLSFSLLPMNQSSLAIPFLFCFDFHFNLVVVVVIDVGLNGPWGQRQHHKNTKLIN